MSEEELTPQQQLYAALAKAQGEMVAVGKSKTNPHFKSKYASLDDIIEMAKPILAENGLASVQSPTMSGDDCGVITKVIHKGGYEMDCGLLLLPLGRGGGAQGAGSSITYARRYAYSAVLSIACDDDDDGNAAQKEKPAKPVKTPEQLRIQEALAKFAEEHSVEAAKGIVESFGVKMAADLPAGSLDKVLERIGNVE